MKCVQDNWIAPPHIWERSHRGCSREMEKLEKSISLVLQNFLQKLRCKIEHETIQQKSYI